MKKFFILLLSLILLLEFAPIADARGGRGGGGRGGGRGGRSGFGRGRGGKSGGSAKAESKIRDLENDALHRAAREDLGEEI